MTGFGRVACAMLALAAGFGLAQKIECKPRKVCEQPVLFMPAEPDYVDAIGGYLVPDVPDAAIDVELKRDKRYAFDVEMAASPWTGPGPLDLEVRITVSGKDEPTQVLGWMPLDQVPVTVLQSDTKKSSLAIEYRLRVSGAEAPGRYATTVTTHVWDENDKHTKKDTITNEVSVVLPSYLLVRVRGAATTTGSVTFDLSSDLSGYLRAVSGGSTVPPTGATFDAVEVATNDPDGYLVTVSVAPASPTAAGVDVSSLSLFGAPADGQTLVSDRPTLGYEVVVRPSDFGLRLDGEEPAGETTFVITYQATRRR